MLLGNLSRFLFIFCLKCINVSKGALLQEAMYTMWDQSGSGICMCFPAGGQDAKTKIIIRVVIDTVQKASSHTGSAHCELFSSDIMK